ncbi:MAG TPA: hypothetical protein PKL13_00375 [bacterium]|nr:hypothetical protein [bacterium]
MTINWKTYYIICVVLLLALIFNFFYFQGQISSIIIGVLYFLFFGLFFGHLFFRKYNILSKLVFGIILLVSYIMILGGIFYYLWGIYNISIVIICVLAPLFLGFSLIHHPLKIKFNIKKPTYLLIVKIVLAIIYLILFYFQIKYLYSKGTSDSINTPWKIISSNFFISYFIGTVVLFLLFLVSKQRIFLIFASIHYFLSFSVILFIYKLGFGYDPYLHQASEKMIFNNGIFLPKPFYYIGQYSLVVFLSKIFMFPVQFFDKILLPLLSSIFLPIVVFQSLKDNLNINKKVIFSCVLIFLIIPFSNFTYTTPQALANLLTIVLIFLSISYVNRKLFSIIPLFIIAISICFIHPISGLPALIFVFLLMVLYELKIHTFIRFVLGTLTYFMSSISLPLSFWIYNKLNNLDFSKIEQLSSANLLKNLIPQNLFYTRFVGVFDFIYFYFNNINFFVIVISIIGLIFVLYYRQLKKYFIYIIMFSILLINYLIVIRFIKFPFLSVFATRIFDLSFYFLLPFFILGVVCMFNTLILNKSILKIFVIVFFSFLLTISFYLSYPRSDKYENFKGYSVSSTHYKIVDYIEKNFEKSNYIVLADQSVGAALIDSYGFKKYFKEEFYYSLPTNIKGNIYSDFIQMTKEESYKLYTVKNVADKTGATLVIFVLNNYWDYTDKLLEEHKKLAHQWVEIDNGRAYIFEYIPNLKN